MAKKLYYDQGALVAGMRCRQKSTMTRHEKGQYLSKSFVPFGQKVME